MRVVDPDPDSVTFVDPESEYRSGGKKMKKKGF
jgi:hypothetical protein